MTSFDGTTVIKRASKDSYHFFDNTGYAVTIVVVDDVVFVTVN